MRGDLLTQATARTAGAFMSRIPAPLWAALPVRVRHRIIDAWMAQFPSVMRARREARLRAAGRLR